MKIGIIGAGSMGLLFASYLSSVLDITLYTRTVDQANEINSNGLLLKKGNEENRILVTALPFSDWIGSEDLTIVTVKQHQLKTIFNKMSDFSINPKSLLFLQNGMGHIKLLEQISSENIFVGTVEHGALKLDSCTVQHNGKGLIKAAVFKGDQNRLQDFISKFPPEFPMELSPDYYQMLLDKLIINAAINPLTGILEVMNGELLENEFYFVVLSKLFNEIIYILNKDNANDHFEQIVKVCKNTAENRSSMLRDLDAKRMTEVEPILGFLLEEADRQGKAAPQISCLYNLIKGKESAWGDSF